MANSNLSNAKNAKNDEFYTQYADIEKEIMAYLEYNPQVFQNKTILLPCDEPEWSNFTKFFAQNFERFGLRKLISTSYAHNSKNYKSTYQPTIFETNAPHYDQTKTITNGKIFTLTADNSGDNKIDIDDLQWQYLAGDGDFRSKEIKKLRDEADIIITNPPFSLFREFLTWITPSNKQFLIIGNMNAITYKELFPLIKENKMWLGATNFNTGMYFKVPPDFVYADTYKFEKERNGEKVNRVPGVCWFTNLEHGRRHNPLPLMTMQDNLRFNKKLTDKQHYDQYDNYDAIEVPFTDVIPSDYEGVMGVPISFLDKYCPEQFDIVEMLSSAGGGSLGTFSPNELGLSIKDKRPLLNGKTLTHVSSSSTKTNKQQTMKTILRTDITIKDICEGFVYNELEGKGLFGLSGKLTIQPEYQRNYIYADGKKDLAVIESLLKGYPLGLIYFNKISQDQLEILDGRQRITSFGRYVSNKFAVKDENGMEQYFGGTSPPSLFYKKGDLFYPHSNKNSKKTLT